MKRGKKEKIISGSQTREGGIMPSQAQRVMKKLAAFTRAIGKGKKKGGNRKENRPVIYHLILGKKEKKGRGHGQCLPDRGSHGPLIYRNVFWKEGKTEGRRGTGGENA